MILTCPVGTRCRLLVGEIHQRLALMTSGNAASLAVLRRCPLRRHRQQEEEQGQHQQGEQQEQQDGGERKRRLIASSGMECDCWGKALRARRGKCEVVRAEPLL